MRWPLTSRRNSVPRARYEQVIDQRDKARTEAAEHVCKIVELCGEIDGLREQLAARNATDWQGQYETEKKRADQLQKRLDDACGLTDPRLENGRYWQHTRADKQQGVMS